MEPTIGFEARMPKSPMGQEPPFGMRLTLVAQRPKLSSHRRLRASNSLRAIRRAAPNYLDHAAHTTSLVANCLLPTAESQKPTAEQLFD
ncbi:MAG: hypothetical protein ACP5O7_11070, partial [Phycisphaerae bacterium]